MISIITVTWNSYDFLELLLESLDRFSTIQHDVLVVDNSDEKKDVTRHHVHQFPLSMNIGHGKGLNYGVAQSYIHFPHNQFIMFLDVDCHVLCHGWEQPFLHKLRHCDVLGGRGVPSKPIRPACMIMKKEMAKYDWSDSLGYRGNRNTPEGYDVAIRAYHQMLIDKCKIGFLESTRNHYGTLNGEEWCINGMPLVYHHWSGTWLEKRQSDFPDINLLEDKKILFSKIPWRMP